jgi:HEAT repeat protein
LTDCPEAAEAWPNRQRNEETMRHILCIAVLFFGMVSRSRAFVDFSPTLGKVISQSDHIVVLEVEQVNREKQVIVFKRVAELKGKGAPEVVKHQITDGFHARQSRTILDWAEPGEIAVCLLSGGQSLTYIGGYWYHCSALEAPWWTMIRGRRDMLYAYSGSTAKLRHHVASIVSGREVVVTALKFDVIARAASGNYVDRKIERWATLEAVSSGRLMRGREWPVWRIKAGLKLPDYTYGLVHDSLVRDANYIVGDGPAGPENVPALIGALGHEDARVRIDSADDLGLIGPAAADAVPALCKVMENDTDQLARLAAAKAIAAIDPKNDTAIATLVEALKDKTGKVRRRAAQSLGDLGPRAKSAVGTLINATKDSDPTVGWAAVDALGQINSDPESTVPALVDALENATTRGAAVDSLGQFGQYAQSAIPALEHVLKGDDVTVRWAAATALVRIGGVGARPGVRFLLKPEGVSGRSLHDAAEILTAPTAREALPELVEAAREPALRDAVAAICGNVVVYLKKDQVPAGVTKLLKDQDVSVRCVAAWTLYSARAVEIKDTIAVQRETLKDADPWARRQAARFLGKLGPSAKDAADDLSALLGDKDEGVRDAASTALKSIQHR